MKNKNLSLQAGFAPFVILAIVAVLALGGGAYVVTKNRKASIDIEMEAEADIKANENAEANANANANLGVGATAKGSLRSLLAMGQNVMCNFTSTAGGVTSSGSVYISADGSMRGDFTSQTSAGTQTSSMIVKDKTSYVWSGSQGVKMDVSGSSSASASTSAQTKSNVDLDSQVDYKCSDWTLDQSKFAVPSSVNFLDIEAMMKGSGAVNVNGLPKLPGQ